MGGYPPDPYLAGAYSPYAGYGGFGGYGGYPGYGYGGMMMPGYFP